MTEEAESIVFSGVVTEKGHVQPDAVNSTRGRLAKWKGRRVTVTVERYIKSKTNAQLNFFHGPVVQAWSEWTGYSLKEMKKELKKAYLDPVEETSKLTGEVKFVIPSLADLNVEQMSAFLDRVLMEGRTQGIEFPEDMLREIGA